MQYFILLFIALLFILTERNTLGDHESRNPSSLLIELEYVTLKTFGIKMATNNLILWAHSLISLTD